MLCLIKCASHCILSASRDVSRMESEAKEGKGTKMRKNCQLCITMASLMFNNRSSSQKKTIAARCFDGAKSIIGIENHKKGT